MPIDFGPPSAQVQGFNIPAPQYTDPLETLARMQQMKTQGIQQQTAQLGLQQAQMKMNSQRALLQAFADAGKEEEPQPQTAAAAPAPAPSSPFVVPSVPGAIGAPTVVPGLPGAAPSTTAPAAPQPPPPTGSAYLDRVFRSAVKNGVLPDDLIALQNHVLEIKQKTATLNEAQQKIYKDNADAVAGAYQQDIPDQGTLNAVNSGLIARHVPQEMLLPTFPAANEHFTSKQQILAHANSVQMLSQLLANQKETALTEEAKERTATEKLTGQAKTQEIAAGQLPAALRDVQLAEKDPATGGPTPAAWARIRQTYPGLNLPANPTPDYLAQMGAAAVPEKEKPAYQLAQMKLKLGIFGDNPEEMYLARYAKALGKSVSELTFPEYSRGMQQYAETKADPVMRSIAISQKNLQEQLTQAQVASLPNPKSIDTFAQMLLNHDMSPSQFAELRSGRVSWAPQVFQRAQEIATSQGKSFSPSQLDADYGGMQKAQEQFAAGPAGDRNRSFSNVMEHMGLLDEARKALPLKGSFPFMRAIANRLGIAAGSDAQTTYDLISQYVGEESVKAFVAGGGTEADRAKTYSNFSRNLGDQQIKTNELELMKILDAQRKSSQHQYDQATFGKGTLELYTPEAMTVRDRFLGPREPTPRPGATPTPAPAVAPAAGTPANRQKVMGPLKISIKDGNGDVHVFDSEAAAKNFESLVKASGGKSTRVQQ